MNGRSSAFLVAGSVVVMGVMVWRSGVAPTVPPSSAVEVASSDTTLRSHEEHRVVQGSPLSLTASDGTGLKLTHLVARAEVQEPLAFTELRLTFENPEMRLMEGTFRITLPRGATVSRFAMKIGGRWQEGEVVEKQAARVAYEDFLHRRQDPALLEQAGGNEFSARVFPIPANGVKEILLPYSQELTDAAPYALHLRGLPELGVLDVSVTEGGSTRPVQTLVRRDHVPDADFVFDAKGRASNPGLRVRNMVLAKVRAQAETAADPVGGAVVLVDTSASRALGYREDLALVAGLVERLAEQAKDKAFRVAAFDQEVVTVFGGEGRAFGADALAGLRKRLPLGASNLERALTWAGEEAKRAGVSRVIVVGDGVTTAGIDAGEAFGAVLARMRDSGVARIDAIAVGGIQDQAVLGRLVRGALPRDGVVIDGALGVTNAVRRLNATTLAEVAIDVPDAVWHWPMRLEGVQTGDEVLVYADVPEGKPFRIAVGGKPATTPDLRSAEEPLLERAFVQAQIARLLDEQARAPKPERVKAIVGLSVEHRVLSPYTALLVLETEQDYARFNIDRNALKDVLSMESGRLVATHRTWPFDAPKREESREVHAKPKGSADPRRAEDGVVAPGAARPADSDRNAEADLAFAPARPDPLLAASAEEENAPRTEPAPATMATAAPAAPARAMAPAARPAASLSESIGMGGLGLAGSGAGGGGRADATGARGAMDFESGVGQNFGSGVGRLGGAHATPRSSFRVGVIAVSGTYPVEVVQRVVRQSGGRFSSCFESGLRRAPGLQGRVSVRIVVGKDGDVRSAADAGSDLADSDVIGCVVRAFDAMSFPSPDGREVTATVPILFLPRDPSAPPAQDDVAASGSSPYSGQFQVVMDALAQQGAEASLAHALAWREESPGDVLALIALAEAYEASGDRTGAARAYGSLIDLFGARADLRRFAGERLERIAGDEGLALAVDTYGKAVAQRPDHPSSHRLLAFARLRQDDPAGAFDAALAGASRSYPAGRFAGVERILREDLGLIAAAWIKKEPNKRAEIQAHLREAGATLESAPSLRFVLNWETDANDVDFHIRDANGGHAYYASRHLASGGELYADVTTGYGPECFTIRKGKGQRAAPYTLQAHYYSRGPMGYGMGKLEVIDHDGRGGLTFEQRPFVVMEDQAYVDLGTVKR